MLNLILMQTEGAEYLNTGAGKAVGLVALLVGVGIAVYVFRKVLAAKAKKAVDKAKDKLP
jgi:ribosomal protein L16/L10AE